MLGLWMHPAMRNDRISGRRAQSVPFIVIISIIVVIMFLLIFGVSGMETISGLRSFVGSEGLWSKSQKKAVIYLLRYASNRGELEYEASVRHLEILNGYKQARLELEKINPDLEIVNHGFIKGGTNPLDVRTMIVLFRLFRNIEHIDRAIHIWEQGDDLIVLLTDLAEKLHQQVILAEQNNDDNVKNTIVQIMLLDDQLTIKEDEFSGALGEASRWATKVLLWAMSCTAFISAIICVWLLRFVDEIFKQRLRDTNAQLVILDAISEGICGLDLHENITFINPNGASILGWTVTELIGRPQYDIFSSARSNGFPHTGRKSTIHTAIEDGVMCKVDHEVFCRKDGTYFPVEYSCTPILDNNKINGAVIVFRDISIRKAQEKKEQNSQSSRIAISAMLETGAAPLSMADQLRISLEILLTVPWLSLKREGSIFLLDEAGENLVMAAQIGLPSSLTTLCAKVPVGHCLCGQSAQRREIIRTNHIDDSHAVRFPGMQPHGHYCVPIVYGERLQGVLNLYVPDGYIHNHEEEAFLTTISHTLANLIEQRKNEEILKHIAGHDVLTGLPNRALFQVRLSEHLAMATRSGSEVVLMFLDLDRFKQVNDTMGHKAGDELLREATRRILSCVRPYDLVARLGGDEFTIILPQLTQTHYVKFIARRILEELAKPFHLSAGEANVSGSIGITLFPQDAQEMDSLLKHADTAMYYAKNAGRNAFNFFTEEMQSVAMQRLKMEEELRAALQNQEFVLYYQPKLDMTTNQIMGMEALIRWEKPKGNSFELVPPDVFIPLAEESGLIVQLGEWVINTACRQNKVWQEQGLPPLRVAVNLSASQFRRPEALVETVTLAIKETLLEPEFLELEITESMVMEDATKAIRTMKIFQEMRIKLAVDDFGTGYSSLGSLRKFPIHALKIDRTFIRDLTGNDSEDAAIVHAILSMAKSLRLTVVAEGVEAKEQIEFLRSHGCDEIQGYYLSRPLPADAFADFLKRHISQTELVGVQ
ncbi:MAG: EAL domain-containing protein [Magnetococcales bacterium]|nr:EAL domain-containing protein [Magnetococcales bacterium]